jgi:glycosyltransferase involved in cell wall biosynthesis
MGLQSRRLLLTVTGLVTSRCDLLGREELESTLRTDGPLEPFASAGKNNHYGFVVFSHLRWCFVWQRPQQFLSRFAKEHPVLFVEEPDFILSPGSEPYMDLNEDYPNVTVAAVRLPADLRGSEEAAETMRRFTREAIDKVNKDGAFDNPLLYYYSPMDAGWSLGHFKARGVVYDCMDELAQFRGAPGELVANEQKLIAAADVVFTGGYSLWLKKSKQHSNAHFFGCGVEYDHFAKAQDQDKPIPDDVCALKGPIVGWFGVVDERVDYDLLAELAKLRPEYNFVVVGPAVKVDPNDFPQAPNLHFLGGRDYKVLPDYCRGFDACMMCFALNEATEYINPTKALEYLATGKPVVSTPVPDVVRQYSDTIAIAGTPEEFALAIDRALQNPDREMIEAGIQKAQSCGWESTVAQMQSLIDQAISEKTAYVL